MLDPYQQDSAGKEQGVPLEDMDYLGRLWAALDFASMEEALLRVVSVLLCLVIHETSHGAMAYLLGDPTARRNHRLSLNPVKHIDWLGLAAMLFVGVGWAKPVPVDPRYFKKPKQGMALTALAGPIANFLLALLALLCLRFTLSVRVDGSYNALNWFLLRLAILSVGLGLFNLIPIPPLDGSKVVAAFLPDRIYAKLMRYERYGMILVIILMSLRSTGNLLNQAILWTVDLLSHIVG